MKSKLQEKRQEGFTIIEVLIVLAIAGLIILIVFLAVPALQRNSRNTQRKNDVSALVGAMNEFVSNNNGAFPATCAAGAGAGQCNEPSANTWLKGASLGAYDKNNISFTRNTAAPTSAAAPNNGDNVIVHTFLKCSGTGTTSGGASSRSAVALYSVESGNNTFTPQCVEL